MGNRLKTTKFLASSLLALSPALVFAAGLGKLSVLSGLGQPLKAEVEVVAVQASEGDSLSAKVASPAAFQQAGIEYSGVMTQLKANVIRQSDGRYVITLSTPQPVEEPYLDVLLELNSPTGRLLRQYTFLLDPVGYKSSKPAVAPPVVAPAAPAVETPAPVEARSLPAPAPAVEPAPSAAPIASATPAPSPITRRAPEAKPVTAVAPAATAGTGATYQVKQGDTLGKIAAAYKPAELSLDQMLVAIHRANKGAFIQGNMNLVRSGQVLTIPDAQSATQVPEDEARHVVDTQAREFNDYRNKLAQSVAAGAATGGSGEQRATGRITTKGEEKPAAEAAKDQLRLSKAETSKAGAGAGTASADDVVARDKALREAKERVTELERNVGDLQKLVELKNQQLAALQKQAQTQTQAQGKAAEAVKTPEPATVPEVPSAAGTVAPTPAPGVEAPIAPAPEAATPETPAAEQAPITATPEAEAPPAAPVATPKAKPKNTVVPPPVVEEPSMFQTLMNNPLALGGIGAAIALLLGLLLWRRRQNASLENSLVGATTTDSSSVFGTTGGRSVDTGSHSMQTDFSQSAIGSIDTDEVDPVAEADVYMAYGRDAQAEEILKEALQKDPTRQAVRLKLLEIYAARKDLGSFETTAGEIYAVTGGSGTDWEKAAALGRTVDPTNPMYGAGSGEATAPGVMAASAAVAAAESAAAVAAYTGPQTDTVQPAEAAEDTHPILDLDLGLKDNEPSPAPDFTLDSNTVKPEDIALDLDLGEAPATQTPAAESFAAEAPEALETEEPEDFSPSGTFIMDAATKKAVEEMGGVPESAGLDIDFRLPDTAPETETKDTAAPAPAAPDGGANLIDLDFKVDEPRAVPAVDLSKISLDLGGDEASGDARWQEVATKLDLAKAYEEMGDKDGAKELLNEVLKEGDSAQQDQARNLLQTMQ